MINVLINLLHELHVSKNVIILTKNILLYFVVLELISVIKSCKINVLNDSYDIGRQ